MTLAERVGELLRGKKQTISVAESCTGGKLGDMITEVPGSSDYFLGGVISYRNDAKVRLLDVDETTLRSKGAVSEEVALQMASGVAKALNANVGVGITGIAGPSGGTRDKPVGLVYIAVSASSGAVCKRNLFKGDRSEIKQQAASKALEMVVDFLTQMN